MNLEHNLLKTISMDLSLIDEYEITDKIFYKNFSKSLFNKLIEQSNKGYKIYQLNDYEQNILKDSVYLLKDNIQGFIAESSELTLSYKTHDILKSGLEYLKNGANLTSILSETKDSLEEVEYERSENEEITLALDYPEIYKEKTLELARSDKHSFYTFSHPILQEYVYMEKGWFGSLIAGTSFGKSIIACILAIDFAKMYNEPVLFVTDENSKDTILLYMKCSYLGLKYRDVKNRLLKLDNYIDKLPKDELKEYRRVFSLIEVWELTGIPLLKVKNQFKKSNKNYGLVMIDSFDEVESLGGGEEVNRYDRNAKRLETLAKELNTIIFVTAQLKSDYYVISAEKMPQLANHQSKSLVKKNFISLLFHCIYDKEGNHLCDVIKINKCRSGGPGIIYKFKKDYDFINIKVDSVELDVKDLKKKKQSEDFDF